MTLKALAHSLVSDQEKQLLLADTDDSTKAKGTVSMGFWKVTVNENTQLSSL
jgi:hypothetical protein